MDLKEDSIFHSPAEKKARRIDEYSERIAFTFLVLWCLLPFLMSLVDFMGGMSGRFPILTSDVLEKEGLTLGQVNYSMAIQIYRLLFRRLGFATSGFVMICLTLRCKALIKQLSFKRSPWFCFLGCLLIWSGICTVLSDNLTNAVLGGSYMNDGFLSYLFYAGVFLCASLIRQGKYRLRILRLYATVVCYLAAIMVIQELTDSAFLLYCFPARRAVVFNQFNHFGYILCMASHALTGLYLYDRHAGAVKRFLYLLAFSFLVYSLLLNETFGSYLAALFVFPVIYFFYARSGRKIHWKILLPPALFLTISVMNCSGITPGPYNLLNDFSQLAEDILSISVGAEEASDAGTGRFALWRDTVYRIAQRPIFGFGPNGFWGKNAITDGKTPHNEYLQVAGYLGIPGLLLYLGALLSLAVRRWKSITVLEPTVLAVSGVMIVYLFSAYFGNPVFNTFPFFWIYYGLTAGPLLPVLADTFEGL